MTARLIDGSALAAAARERLRRRVEGIAARGGRVRLDAILVDSGDSGARLYAANQARACADLGIECRLHDLPASATRDDIAGRVLLLGADEAVTAIMMHLPVPAGVEAQDVQRLIDPGKDVEGVSPANIGNIVYGHSSLAPCTALATLRMIESTGAVLRGCRAVVVGAGDVVGKPIAVLLMRHEATVISCNKWTRDLAELTRSADVLVAAAGVPRLITASMVKPGVVVVDVGVNRVRGPDGKMRTVGDVDFESVREAASWISPVPGGVGPMTVAALLENVVAAAERAART
jgi:methylenetetrahydrofolate dehydrogenase (NADP+)/methenyltetrahydrofolate cyclohydrolase